MRNVFRVFGSCVAILLVVAGCSQETVSGGAALYSANCANCHGRYADGQGPAAADLAGGSSPDLRYLATRNGGTFPREWVTKVIDGREIVAAHGERQMPVWGKAFAELDAANGSSKAQTEAKIQALVDYLVEVQQTH